MKKIFLIITTGLMLGMSSCKKDFLDLSPYDQVPQDQAITDEPGMIAAVNGMYSQLRNAACMDDHYHWLVT
jgi:hypothetical protein